MSVHLLSCSPVDRLPPSNIHKLLETNEFLCGITINTFILVSIRALYLDEVDCGSSIVEFYVNFYFCRVNNFMIFKWMSIYRFMNAR